MRIGSTKRRRRQGDGHRGAAALGPARSRSGFRWRRTAATGRSRAARVDGHRRRQARLEHRRGRGGRAAQRTCSRRSATRSRPPPAGDRVVIVTSGAIARGMRLMELPMRPTRDGGAPGGLGGGPGASSTAPTTSCSRSAACRRAQVLLTFFDMSARTHYLNARHTLQTLLRWRVLPVINENDTTTTDEISFGDNDFLAAQVAILIGADRLVLLTDTGGPLQRGPAPRPRRAARGGGRAASRSSRATTSACRARRSARAGCARRSWPPRWRRPPGSRSSSRAGWSARRWRAALAGEPSGTLLPAAGGPRLELQAVAEVREAHARPARDRRGRRARAARARHEPPAGGRRGGGGRVRGGRRRRGALRRPARWGRGS